MSSNQPPRGRESSSSGYVKPIIGLDCFAIQMESIGDPLHHGMLYAYRHVLLEKNLGVEVSQEIIMRVLQSEIKGYGMRDISFIFQPDADKTSPMRCVFNRCAFCGKGLRTSGSIGDKGVIDWSRTDLDYFKAKRISSYYNLLEGAGYTFHSNSRPSVPTKDPSDDESD